jgi:hypothetical protein
MHVRREQMQARPSVVEDVWRGMHACFYVCMHACM